MKNHEENFVKTENWSDVSVNQGMSKTARKKPKAMMKQGRISLQVSEGARPC